MLKTKLCIFICIAAHELKHALLDSVDYTNSLLIANNVERKDGNILQNHVLEIFLGRQSPRNTININSKLIQEGYALIITKYVVDSSISSFGKANLNNSFVNYIQDSGVASQKYILEFYIRQS